MRRTGSPPGPADLLSRLTERVLEPVEGTHRTVADRWFGPLGPLALPVRRIHDAVSGLVYSSIRLGGRAVGIGLEASGVLQPRTTEGFGAVVDGLWGDPAETRSSMSVRDGQGRPVRAPWTNQDLTGRLVVFVHGLTATERCWSGTTGGPGLADLVEDDPALTPLLIRYNSGLRVSVNGSSLAGLLEEVLGRWPVPVRSVALVGHSMGGLVIRSACEHARATGQSWIEDVTDVITLGTPHRGVPLEKLVGALAWGLGWAAETRPVARFLDGRSAGIKDLRHGAMEHGESGAVARRGLPPDINHHFVAGVVTSDPHHPIGAALGDLMVRAASSLGGSRHRPTDAITVGGVHHFAMLKEPQIAERVMGWLTS